MLPNLYWATITLDPLTIQVWGLWVALGMSAAIWVAQWLAKQRGLQASVILDASFWIILASLIGARLWFVATEWQLFTGGNWWHIFMFWEGGMAMTGGLVGGTLAGIIFFRHKKVSAWRYTELFLFALPLGEAIGRLGCFFIFDHPGTVTNFWLGEVYYGDGLVRHNHGLYLAISGALLFAGFMWLAWHRNMQRFIQPPFFITLYLLWSGAVRLVLDNWRVADSEFGGLTAAQWAGLVMIVAALVMFGQRQNIRKRYLQ